MDKITVGTLRAIVSSYKDVASVGIAMHKSKAEGHQRKGLQQ